MFTRTKTVTVKVNGQPVKAKLDGDHVLVPMPNGETRRVPFVTGRHTVSLSPHGGATTRPIRPSERRKAERELAKQRHAAIAENAVHNARQKWLEAPLDERVKESDAGALMEFAMRVILADPELRAGMRHWLDEADRLTVGARADLELVRSA